MQPIIYDPKLIDFDKPGKQHYQLAFGLDSSWGFSLVPLTVINGLRKPARAGATPRAWPPSAEPTATSGKARSRSSACAGSSNRRRFAAA